MIVSSTERLASYPVTTTAAQNEHNGDMNSRESIAFSRGRQSVGCSVWYNGWLMTFLATGEETQGKFALIEAVGRKGNVPTPHIHHQEDEIFYVLEGEVAVSVNASR